MENFNKELEISNLKENKNIDDKKRKFISDLKNLEIESVKYLIKNYLRVRLIKVDLNIEII